MNDFFKTRTFYYSALILLPVCMYLKSLWYGFSSLDDQWLIVTNSYQLGDWGNFLTLFKSPIIRTYYRPLLVSSFMIDYHIGQLSPFIYHFTNLLLHILSILLFYQFLIRLQIELKLAFILVLIFSIHPALLHAVVWLPGRNDTLLTVFALLSSNFFLDHLQSKKIKYLVFHLILFVCTLLTKENAIVLPLFFFVLAFNFNRSKKEFVVFTTAWIIIIAGWFLLRSTIINSSLSTGTDISVSLKNFTSASLLFLGKTLIPVNLSVFPTLAMSSLIPGILTLTIFSVAYLKFGVKNKIIALSGVTLYFTVLMIPVWYGASSATGEHYEHRIYLPLIGMLLFISQLNFNINSKLFNYTATTVIFVFGIKTFKRMDVYKNEQRFIETGIKEAPQYYLFHVQKGTKLFEENDFDRALVSYNKAIELQPGKPEIYNSRANIYAYIKEYDKAIKDYSKAIELAPNDPQVYLNRAICSNSAHEVDMALEDLNFLKQHYPAIVPVSLDEKINSHWNDITLQKVNNEILADSTNASLFVKRAKVYSNKKMNDLALIDVKTACRLEPENAKYKVYLNNLGYGQ